MQGTVHHAGIMRRLCFLGCFLGCLCLSLASSALSKEPVAGKLPLDDLQRFSKVIEYIREYYVNPVSDEVLFENAMRGMLSGLDPHSSYFDAEEFADLKANTSGQFGGLGVEVLPEDGYIRVISPLDDSPAQRAGVQAGDLIVRINDTPIKGLTTREAIELMRGEKGSKVKLTIVRQSEAAPLILEVTRDTIHVQSIRGKMLDNRHAYIRIAQFQTNSGDDLIKTIQTLKKNNGDVLAGIVLDLRNNLGGVVESAVQVADTFLDRDKLKEYDGLIVYAKGRVPDTQLKEKAHGSDILKGAPIVVLINAGTASASEIVAGALQDYHRAIIVGTQSFGKGSMQTVFPLKDNRGIKLTTQLYYTPSGRSIQATGIKPDVVVQNLRIPEPTNNEDVNALVVHEEDLIRHLENGNKKGPDAKADPKKAATDSETSNLLYKDYQLYEGLNILKALTLTYKPIN